jgi:hypothetical protein
MGRSGVPARARLARGKAKRAWLRAPFVKQWSEARYAAQLERHADKLPRLAPDRAGIATDLRQECVAQREVTTMIPDVVLDVADRFVADLRRSTSPERTVRVAPVDLAADPALFLWGLTDENLDLAENHIGMPVHYLGVEVKRERADGRAEDVRQWHMDIEDRRMLKMIVYLSYVDDGCGPFEYIDATRSGQATRALRYSSGFVSDDVMDRVVPRESWRRVVGPRLSTVFVDSSRIFHRVLAPTTTDRYSMTFSYSSIASYQVFPEFMLSAKALRGLAHELTPRQRAASRID